MVDDLVVDDDFVWGVWVLVGFDWFVEDFDFDLFVYYYCGFDGEQYE